MSEVDTSLAKEISEHTRLQPNVFVVPFIVSLRAPYALNTILEPLEILLLRRLVQKTPPMNPILPTNCPQSHCSCVLYVAHSFCLIPILF